MSLVIIIVGICSKLRKSAYLIKRREESCREKRHTNSDYHPVGSPFSISSLEEKCPKKDFIP
jgi:hypothetical protein